MLYRTSGVDYNGFSPCRSIEVDRVYLTFLFNCIIYLSVLQAECSLT